MGNVYTPSNGFAGNLSSGYIGEISYSFDTTPPRNCLLCNGQVINVADYPKLAKVFKDVFGVYNKFGGDGFTTFALPDLTGRYLKGSDVANIGTFERDGLPDVRGRFGNISTWPHSLEACEGAFTAVNAGGVTGRKNAGGETAYVWQFLASHGASSTKTSLKNYITDTKINPYGKTKDRVIPKTLEIAYYIRYELDTVEDDGLLNGILIPFTYDCVEQDYGSRLTTISLQYACEELEDIEVIYHRGDNTYSVTLRNIVPQRITNINETNENVTYRHYDGYAYYNNNKIDLFISRIDEDVVIDKVVGYRHINVIGYNKPIIGEIKMFHMNKSIPDGWVKCDGTEIDVREHPEMTKLCEILGACGFGTNDVNIFKLPDLEDRYLEGSSNLQSEYHEAGVPNISGQFGGTNGYYHSIETCTGAFHDGWRANSAGFKGGSNNNYAIVNMDAHNSSNVYGREFTSKYPMELDGIKIDYAIYYKED